MTLIKPFLQADSFLQDVQDATGDERVLQVWWLGQSGFLLKWQNRFLLFDPYLSDSLTQKYAATDKPHVRMTERVVAPERLNFVDVVTSSHNHTDHLDGETLGPLIEVNADLQLVIPEANRAFATERLGCDHSWPVGLDGGDYREVGGFRFHGIAAAHEELERDDEGRCKFLGYVATFGPWTVYHSGDTVHYSGLVERLTPFNVDVAFLPINGSKPERKVAGNLNGIEAATLACAINAKLAIPCHYEMFTFNTAPPDSFIAAAAALEQPIRVLQAGERCTIEKSTTGVMTVRPGA